MCLSFSESSRLGADFADVSAITEGVGSQLTEHDMSCPVVMTLIRRASTLYIAESLAINYHRERPCKQVHLTSKWKPSFCLIGCKIHPCHLAHV